MRSSKLFKDKPLKAFTIASGSERRLVFFVSESQRYWIITPKRNAGRVSLVIKSMLFPNRPPSTYHKVQSSSKGFQNHEQTSHTDATRSREGAVEKPNQTNPTRGDFVETTAAASGRPSRTGTAMGDESTIEFVPQHKIKSSWQANARGRHVALGWVCQDCKNNNGYFLFKKNVEDKRCWMVAQASDKEGYLRFKSLDVTEEVSLNAVGTTCRCGADEPTTGY